MLGKAGAKQDAMDSAVNGGRIWENLGWRCETGMRFINGSSMGLARGDKAGRDNGAAKKGRKE